MTTLEQTTNRIDWKEWIPAWGFYQNHRDKKAGKRSILYGKDVSDDLFAVYLMYQICVSAGLYAGSVFGLAKLICRNGS